MAAHHPDVLGDEEHFGSLGEESHPLRRGELLFVLRRDPGPVFVHYLHAAESLCMMHERLIERLG